MCCQHMVTDMVIISSSSGEHAELHVVGDANVAWLTADGRWALVAEQMISPPMSDP